MRRPTGKDQRYKPLNVASKGLKQIQTVKYDSPACNYQQPKHMTGRIKLQQAGNGPSRRHI